MKPLTLFKCAKYIVISFTLIALACSIATTIVIVSDDSIFNNSFKLNPQLASEIGDFIGGLLGATFSILGTFLVILTLLYQTIENRKTAVTNQFFKMLDFHQGNVENLKIKHIKKGCDDLIEGRRSFVIFRLQIKQLLKSIKEINEQLNLQLSNEQLIDVVYTVFYYGIDREWDDFLDDKLASYDKHREIVNELIKKKQYSRKYEIGRTNQTSLSSYFRNMYNAIKMIDTSNYLTENEKMTNVKILRAQLSNPELYVLYYNIMSRFGKKWKENKYVTKYEFLTNLPAGYCDEFNPNNDFPIQYEEEELAS